MAHKNQFEDHCWRDLYSNEDYATYAPYIRETFIGKKPAVLAIDLYNLVYKGGARPPHEIIEEFPSTCGKYAYEAIDPIVKLLAAGRQAGLPVYYVTGLFSPNRVRSTRRDLRKTTLTENDYEIYEAFSPQPEDVIILELRSHLISFKMVMIASSYAVRVRQVASDLVLWMRIQMGSTYLLLKSVFLTAVKWLTKLVYSICIINMQM